MAFDGDPRECLASEEMQQVYFGVADPDDVRRRGTRTSDDPTNPTNPTGRTEMAHELVASGIGVRYGEAVALTDVDLMAPGGSVTALVGPNGAGKSSLLLALYGSVAAAGTVTVDGEDLSRLSATRRVRAGMAIVPQGRQLFPRLNVRENLQLMAELLQLGRGRTSTRRSTASRSCGSGRAAWSAC